MAEIRFGARAGIEALLEIVVEPRLMVGEVQAFGEAACGSLSQSMVGSLMQLRRWEPSALGSIDIS